MIFKNRLSSIGGMAFQNFFVDIMQRANSNFVPVKPQGNQGDWKNDGHDPVAGRYYQVYSPEQFDESRAVKKLAEDFDGLLEKWGDKKVYTNGVKEFYFALNDYYRIVQGGYPTTIAALASLKIKHKLNKCDLFRSKHLEDELFALPDDEVYAVIGFPPNPGDINVLKIELVHDVITHIVETTSTRSIAGSLVGPDFDDKIAFNRLAITGGWLRDASYRFGTLEQYFNFNSDFKRQDIRDRLKSIYEESKTLGYQDDPSGATSADQQLVFVLDKVTPKPQQANQRLEKELQDAALVIMAFFFESCDIFEEPIAC